MMHEIRLIATLVAKENKAADISALCRALVPLSRRDDGCIQYDLHEDSENPGTFVFFEVWENQHALDKHNATSHINAFMKEAENNTESVDIQFIRKLD